MSRQVRKASQNSTSLEDHVGIRPRKDGEGKALLAQQTAQTQEKYTVCRVSGTHGYPRVKVEKLDLACKGQPSPR